MDGSSILSRGGACGGCWEREREAASTSGGGSGKGTSVWNGFCKRLWSIKGPTENAYFFYLFIL